MEDIEKRRKRLIRMKFKKFVAMVIQHRHWSKGVDDRFVYNSCLENLNFQTRVALCQKPENRTQEDLKLISLLLSELNVFKKWDLNIHELSRYAAYQVVFPGKVILREGQPAYSLLVIISGDVNVIVPRSDDTLTYSESFVHVTLPFGTIFGDFELLYGTPRSATVKALTMTELIIFPKKIFNAFIKSSLQKHSDLIDRYMNNFKCFDKFTVHQRNEACFYGRVKEYDNGSILYNFKKRMEVTFFVVNGTCDLIEVLQVIRRINENGEDAFALFDSQQSYFFTEQSRQSVVVNQNTLATLNEKNKRSMCVPKLYTPFRQKAWYSKTEEENLSNDSESTYSQNRVTDFNAKSHPLNKKLSSFQDIKTRRLSMKPNFISVVDQRSFKKDGNRYSRITSDEYLAFAAKLGMRRTVTTNLKQRNRSFRFAKQFVPYETHYMKIATYSQNACFNIGEMLKNRLIVANEPMTVLEIPKKLLAKQRYVYWDQLRRSLDLNIPNDTHVFSKFIKDRVYRKWKNNFLASIKEGKSVSSVNCNTVHNVPYSIRIKHDFEYVDQMQISHSMHFQ